MPRTPFLLACGSGLAFYLVALLAGVEPGRDLAVEGRSAVIVAALGVGLLVLDAAAPVPSTVVMAGLGVTFGPVLGIGLSVVGLVAGAGLAYWAGKLASSRDSSSAWTGTPRAVVLTGALRPVPIIGEALAFTAGAGRMPLGWFLGSTTVASVAIASASCAAGSTWPLVSLLGGGAVALATLTFARG